MCCMNKNIKEMILINIKTYIFLGVFIFIFDSILSPLGFSLKKFILILFILLPTSIIAYRYNKWANTLIQFSILFIIIVISLKILDLLNVLSLFNGILFFIVPIIILMLYYKYNNIYIEIQGYLKNKKRNNKHIILENIILLIIYTVYVYMMKGF
ncbi:hypothetical protein [Tepidibacter thalassicus]|uniref:Uncharacterized protein n=1 Tax=Tepidibacter thalassicus DSM 15285 TaxID=1123350 RepID=A0A1M5TV30_9FIRM|nr:hypothetical protein [Tepidibacter thalassicus]SHH54490.1 hypothetical protein SAMN02744040_02306 [Tepidibacter thalassicus DSM 15285]